MAAVHDKSAEVNKQGLNLSVLEDKVVRLVEVVKQLKAENTALAEENSRLRQSLDTLEKSLMLEAKDVEELSQEKAMTRVVVDDLIKSIDALVSDAK